MHTQKRVFWTELCCGCQHPQVVEESVCVTLKNIHTKFDTFSWAFDKTSFPRVKDDGKVRPHPS